MWSSTFKLNPLCGKRDTSHLHPTCGWWVEPSFNSPVSSTDCTSSYEYMKAAIFVAQPCSACLLLQAWLMIYDNINTYLAWIRHNLHDSRNDLRHCEHCILTWNAKCLILWGIQVAQLPNMDKREIMKFFQSTFCVNCRFYSWLYDLKKWVLPHLKQTGE